MALKPVITNPSANFTRPANTTAYASGDLVADNTTAGSVTPLSFTIAVTSGRGLVINGIKLETDNTTETNGDFRIWFYTSSPTVTNGDNGTFESIESNYVGRVALDSLIGFSDAIASYTVLDNTEAMRFKLSTGETLYALLEARGAYTPASGEVFTVTLNVEHY